MGTGFRNNVSSFGSVPAAGMCEVVPEVPFESGRKQRKLEQPILRFDKSQGPNYCLSRLYSGSVSYV